MARDNATTATFDVLYTAVKVALTQALVTASHNAEDAWMKDIVNTEDLLARVRTVMDTDAIVEHAATAWKNDLSQVAVKVHDNPWLSESGVAALLGCAAGGISGAVSAARSAGLEARVQDVRVALLERVDQALTELTDIFVDAADSVHMSDAATLRLRASEYLAHS